MPFLQRPGAAIYYEVDEGSGSWVTLLNGHSRPLTDFRTLRKRLLEAGYRVLVYDPRGSGGTQESEPFSSNDLLVDAEAMWEHLGINRCALIGLSMGGVLGQHLFSRNPWVIERLLLVSTASAQQDFLPEIPWGNSAADVEKKLASYVATEFLLKNRLLIQAMAKQVAKKIAEGNFLERTKMQRYAVQDLVNRLDSLPIQLAQSEGARLMAIHGQKDKVIQQQSLTGLRRRYPGIHTLLYPDIGHLPLAECPDRLATDILGFLATAN